MTRKNTAILLTVLILAAAAVGFLGVKNGGSLDFSDTHVKVVVSGSMDGEPREEYDIPSVPIESMVFIRGVPSDPATANDFYSSLKVGDVLTFDYIHPVSREHMAVTHRIVSVSETAGVYTYQMQGDAIADDPLNHSVQIVTSDSGDVIGKVTGVSPVLGELTIFLSTAEGKVCLIGIPCLLLIIMEAGTIVRTLRSKDGDVPEDEGKENTGMR